MQGNLAGECSYLEGGGPDGLGSSLRHITLYHSSDGARGRGVFCLLLPPIKRCLVVVVVPTGIAAKEVAPAALDRAWRELLQGMLDEGLLDEQQVMLADHHGADDKHPSTCAWWQLPISRLSSHYSDQPKQGTFVNKQPAVP